MHRDFFLVIQLGPVFNLTPFGCVDTSIEKPLAPQASLSVDALNDVLLSPDRESQCVIEKVI